jgi:O-methyltransferase
MGSALALICSDPINREGIPAAKGRKVRDMARLHEVIKFAVYHTPVVNRLMAPSYPYKLNPAQLTAMAELIAGTRGTGAAIAEVGVAKGDTSIFLLEHLRTCGDTRTLLLFDTFAGFTQESVQYEVANRGKSPSHYRVFRYGNEERFQRNLTRAGYTRFRTINGDASKFDWSSLAPIGAVLLDIDLYQPTIAVLNSIYPHLLSGGGIVLDDCLAGTAWDGSLQAYEEFITARGLPFERVGQKGALVRKPRVSS